MKPDKTYTVYMATNRVNGKRYIGFSSRGLEFRKERHLYLAAKGDKGCPRFYDAIRKYGAQAFTWIVLAVVLTEKEAFKIERRLISKARRLSEEYNVTDGGEGGRRLAPISLETRMRLREIGLQNKAKWALYSHLGPKAARKRVVCLNTGEVYESARAAAKANDISHSIVIEVCLRDRRRKTAGGLVFRYFGDHLGGKEEAQKMLAERDVGRASYGKSCAKPILCTTYDIRFSSATAAAQEYGICRQSISEACNGKRNSVYGLRFSYLENAQS